MFSVEAATDMNLKARLPIFIEKKKAAATIDMAYKSAKSHCSEILLPILFHM